MDYIEGNFVGVRNTGIHYQAWLPAGEVKAVLVIVHGLGEHCGRYLNVVKHFVPLGFAVYGFDQLGHGQSEGPRELIENFKDYTDTLTIYLGMVKVWQMNKPIFLLGHSMGGLVTGCYLLDHHDYCDGAIFSSPSIKVSVGISSATIVFGKILSVLVPRAGLLALDANLISRDPEVVSACVNDPLVFHGKTPARTAAELLKAMLRISTEANKMTLPFIVLQGDEDKIVNPAGAQMLYDKAGSTDKTIKIYKGLYHEIFNEPERDHVLNDVEIWLARHISKLTHEQ